MSENFGNGVSRTLEAFFRQFKGVIWQKSKPPLDSELNLMAQIQDEGIQRLLRANIKSGFIMDPTTSGNDFSCSKTYSNFFILGQGDESNDSPVLVANVNGWIVPVVGTSNTVDGSVDNFIKLNPPPSTGNRIDFVFLEVWQSLVQMNPSETNKPSADTIWKFGNVEFGGTNIVDDLEDPEIGHETTKRIQIQYRLRVYGSGSAGGASLPLDAYPEGLGAPGLYAQGNSTSPVSPYIFENMGETLGDSSLWRAGDGDYTNSLNTIDGYTYAIPICAIFRRNSSAFSAVSLSGTPNHNGALNRNISASSLTNPREGAKVLSSCTLLNNLAVGATGVVQVSGLTNSGIDELGSLFVKIDNEILQITAVNTGSNPQTITIGSRGRNGTNASMHLSSAKIEIYNPRPDGLFADEIAVDDILDMRHSVNIGDWDYQRLLLQNVSSLIKGTLKTAYKTSTTSSTQGILLTEVSYLSSDGSTLPPSQVQALDGPDGVRTIFSDAATIQPDVTILCDNETSLTGKFTSTTFDQDVSWEVGADFKPSGWMNSATPNSFDNGTQIFLYIGGDDGSQGARASFRDSANAVRFISPKEYWKSNSLNVKDGNQHPITLRFTELVAFYPPGINETDGDKRHPGPMYPLEFLNFEKPFIVLGSLLANNLSISRSAGSFSVGVNGPEIDLGSLNFDTPGIYWSDTGDISSSEGVSNKLLDNSRTLYDMLTNRGRDLTGASSEVYVNIYGDVTNPDNNGAFRVIGAGTVGYTSINASSANSIVVAPLTQNSTFPVTPSSETVTIQFRSQYMESDNSGSYNLGPDAASVVICFTDLSCEEGDGFNPWNANNLTPAYEIITPVSSKLILNTTLQYHPGRAGLSKVPEDISRVSLLSGNSLYLRQPNNQKDATFPNLVGIPGSEAFFDLSNIQLWNRLRAKGLTESTQPRADYFGGQVIASSEQDRESEVFVDKGSKTILLRPFQRKLMTIKGIESSSTPSLVGSVNYPAPLSAPKDAAGIFTTNILTGYAVPSEYMPKFGRQDIPYFIDDSTNPGNRSFLEGINHLFTDTGDPTNTVYYMIGGRNNNTSGNAVYPMFFQTGSTSGNSYCEYGTITGPTTPAYQARLTSEISTVTSVGIELRNRLKNIFSSDLPNRGLKGIQLPPYLGLARLYGVYERNDFISKGGSAFGSDRITPVVDPPTNLLRKDVSKQSLYIFQDGAKDITNETGDHTYIIPEGSLDITRIPSYMEGNVLEDFEYVVECVVFGFAKDWINKNNYILGRRTTGSGVSIIDGVEPELEDVDMCIPCAAGSGDIFYLLTKRVPYQGDPFMTREGETRTTSDYEVRYGQLSNLNASKLSSSIEQYNISTGESYVETPNLRSFQILSSVDFYMTLGTGKIGGELLPGTITDVGYIENSLLGSTRIPEPTGPNWGVYSRAFTEGQNKNETRAKIGLAFLDIADEITIRIKKDNQNIDVTLTSVPSLTPGVDEFWEGIDNSREPAESLTNQINSHPILSKIIFARNDIGISSNVDIFAKENGADGNTIYIGIKGTLVSTKVSLTSEYARGIANNTGSFLSGGRDFIVNAGTGFSQIFLTGASERLPLGILVQDSDLLCENILNDSSSAFKTTSSGLQPIQTLIPLAENGDEYSRFFGNPGEFIAMCDGGVLRYTAFDSLTSPTGSKRYRVYRGGGSCFLLSGKNPGGPLDWVSASFNSSLNPVLKGGALACKALLVRNFKEQAFITDNIVSYGDEIQMVVLTYCVFGNENTRNDGISIGGVISPTGYGEGYAASDRYRLLGKPIFSGANKKVKDPSTVSLASFTKGS